MTTEMKTLTCPGPPEHEFQIPKGRGRPPRYCDEHNPKNTSSNGKHQSEGEKKMEASTRPRPRPGQKPAETEQKVQSQPRPRPRPGAKPEQPAPDSEASPAQLPSVGKSDTGSRAKAENAARRAQAHSDELVAWPTNSEGKPLARIVFSASELIPTGQYANVSIGPAQVTAFIDLDRDLQDDEGYFEPRERDVLIRATNELAEVIERDILAVQRNIVLESMQEQLASS